MSVTISSIVGASFQATVSFPMVSPALDEIEINIPLAFANVSQLRKMSGTYTPNNDYLYLVQGLTIVNTFNFALVLCDAPLNITCSFAASSLALQVQRFGLYSFTLDPSNFVSGCFIDGRTSPNPGNTPMAQGNPVNYSIIYGQAAIT